MTIGGRVSTRRPFCDVDRFHSEARSDSASRRS